MLNFLTEFIQTPFLRPEIIDRLAAMLTFNLVQLVGPKCTTLKVEHPEKYHFKPRALLADVIKILLNLGQHAAFVESISRDGRSYSPQLFERTLSILESRQIVPFQESERFRLLATQCQASFDREQQRELDLGDVPEEFLDPLMFTLMVDPVILPTSRISVDRSTITSHLLSDATDPFNRMPLSLEMILTDQPLKAKIEAWRASRASS